ncbi:MAG: hypothetical protein HYV07_05720 [Deltaproteobacteria bacterium]|nr:hypothetical protein [Deltaproteobacteria bacterium]
MTRALFAALATCFFAGCATDDGEPPEGVTPCEPIASDFDTLYSQLFSTSTCAQLSCHGDEGFQDTNGLRMSGTADEVYAALTSSTADTVGRAAAPRRVAPSEPEASFLWLVLSTDDPPGSYRMPLGGRLDSCKTEAVLAWIEAGALR